MTEDHRRALERINNAIRDTEQATVRDHQNPEWREPADAPQARVAVGSAFRDVQQWEANPSATGWQGRAIRD